MQTNTDWVPAIVMLAVGAVLGIALVWRTIAAKRAERATLEPEVDLELRDLHGKRDALIRQLRELEDTGVKLTPEMLSHERHELELEAARVLRDIERHVRVSDQAKAERDEAPAAAGMTPGQKGLAWAGGSLAVLAILGFVVWQSASQRAPGEGITGGSGMGGGTDAAAAAPQQNDVEILKLQAALQNDPENLDLRLDLANAYLMREDLMAVYNMTQYVLQKQPGHPRALAYEAIVHLAMGQGDLAERMLNEAVTTKPDLSIGWIHLALVHIQLGKFDAAEKDIATVAKFDPREAEALRGIVQQVRAQGAGSQQPPMPAAQPAAASGAKQVSGSLILHESLVGKVAPGSVIYVILRPAGVESGSALAVARLQTGSFPAQFTVGDLQSMGGQPLPDRVRVEARIDGDGNPMSRSADDPFGYAENVAIGATDVKIVMNR
ncbi:MAG: c-type cytochrome biogenesis protein CcmI/CycH [Thermoanaerobaculia bacterium]